MNAESGENKSIADTVVDSLKQKGYEILVYDRDCVEICVNNKEGFARLGTLYLNHDYIKPSKNADYCAKTFINEDERWFLVLGKTDEDLSYRVREIAGEIDGNIEVHVLSPNETPDFNRTGGISLFDDTLL